MHKKITKGISTTALTSLATATYALLSPSPAFASHTCLHYVQAACVDWERLGYGSRPDCYAGESDKWCPAQEAEPAGDPTLAATGWKLPRRAAATALSGPSTAGAPSASAGLIEHSAK